MPASLTRTLIRASAVAVLAAIIAGLPAALVILVGWPLPDTWPTSTDQLTGWLHAPVSDTMIVNLLAVAAWLLWAAFVHATAVEARAAWRGLPSRRLAGHAGNPLRAAAGMLITALTLGTVLTATAAAGTPQPPTAPAAAAPAAAPTQQAAPGQGPATVHVGHTSYSYVVERGDYLSKIAKQWLGDANRWPEICELNWHRHWPKIGGTLHDCDLIYPGWDLRLPEGARPPADAAPTPPAEPPPPANPEPQPEPEQEQEPERSPATATLAPDLDGVVEPSPAATSTPSPTPSPAASPDDRSHPSGSATGDDADPPPDAQNENEPDGGVTLPGGSFVPWTLAAAITAAAACVWLQRRRRPMLAPEADEDGDAPGQLPPPVLELQRHVARHPRLAPPADLAERAAAVPDLPQLPPGGIGLTGEGAPAAARAALVSALASGGPREPDRRGEVVIDGATLSTLIGADAAGLGPWPRLHIADDLGHALTIVESRLLYRSRILDEHSLDDLDTLRQRAPDEEALPPVLLIAETPPAGERMRARVSLGLGAGLDLSALLLGQWDHGTTVQVAADGTTQLQSGPPVDTIGEPMAVLDGATAVQILATLREAHTGQPPPATGRQPQRDRPDPETATMGPQPAGGDEPAGVGGDPQPKVRLRVLGPPRIENVTRPGRGPRGPALEMAVYLACHPGGAPTRELGEYLNPEARVRAADQRVHTNASNLRHVFGRAGGPRKNGYVIKTSGRYRLDPATVEVDLWQLHELLQQATIATGHDRRDLARQACDLYTAPLADGCDYDWIEPYREKARRWGTQAHLLLAEQLLEDDPQQASDLLDRAIKLDRYHEPLYRTAMHARHALGDADGIRTLLRALTKALGDLDAEPDDQSIELATKLRTSLDQR